MRQGIQDSPNAFAPFRSARRDGSSFTRLMRISGKLLIASRDFDRTATRSQPRRETSEINGKAICCDSSIFRYRELKRANVETSTISEIRFTRSENFSRENNSIRSVAACFE